MIRLRFPEGPDRLYFGDDFARPEAAGLDIGDGVQGNSLLRLVLIVDGGAIRCSSIMALAIQGVGSWIWNRNSSSWRYVIASGSNRISIPSACVP